MVEYDSDAAAACIESLRSLGCDVRNADTVATSRLCDRVFPGTIAVGEKCWFHQQCASRVCVNGSIGLDCRMGTCANTARAKLGERCDSSTYCDETTFCNNGICEALRGEGEACESTRDEQCQVGLYCLEPDFGGFQCMRAPEQGEPCHPAQGCRRLGMHCAWDRTCQPIPQIGGYCIPHSWDSQLGFAYCDEATLKCVSHPGLGEKCQGTCGFGLVCDTYGSQTCGMPLDNGETCRWDFPCKSLYCNNVCANLPWCF